MQYWLQLPGSLVVKSAVGSSNRLGWQLQLNGELMWREKLDSVLELFRRIIYRRTVTVVS